MPGTKEACREESRKRRWGWGEVVCLHVYVSMNFWECIRKAEFTDMDGKTQITTAYWFSLLPHTHTHLYYLVSRIKTQLIPADATFLLRDTADGRLWANSEVLMAHWTIKSSNKLSFPLLSLCFCLHEYPLHTHNQFLILCPFLSPSLIKHTIK